MMAEMGSSWHELVAAALQGLVDDEGEEALPAFDAFEASAVEDALELGPDLFCGGFVHYRHAGSE